MPHNTDLQTFIDTVVRRFPNYLREDLRQIAWVTAIELATRELPYVRQAIRNSCVDVLRKELRFSEKPLPDFVVEGTAEIEVWRHQIRSTVKDRCKQSKYVRIGVERLVETKTVQELREQYGMFQGEIYAATQFTKKTLQNDRRLQQLWKDRP